MKDLIDYCKRKNYKLKFIYDNNNVTLTINNENWSPIYYAEASKDAYSKLIRALKTKINLDKICGSKNANK